VYDKMEKYSMPKKQLDPSSHFDKTLAYDRQKDTHTHTHTHTHTEP